MVHLALTIPLPINASANSAEPHHEPHHEPRRLARGTGVAAPRGAKSLAHIPPWVKSPRFVETEANFTMPVVHTYMQPYLTSDRCMQSG